jgi:WD40 repeat protein
LLVRGGDLAEARPYDVLAGLESADPALLAEWIADVAARFPVRATLVSDDPGLAGTITGVEVIAGEAATQALPAGRLPTAVADAVNYQLLAGEQILLLAGVPRERLGVVKELLDPALASTGPIGGVNVTAGTTYALALPRGGAPPAGHVDRITGALLSPDANLLATMDEARCCGIWDVPSGALRSLREVDADWNFELAAALPGGAFLMIAHSGAIVWDGRTGTPRWSATGQDARYSAAAGLVGLVERRWIQPWQAVESEDRLRLYEAETGREHQALPASEYAFSPDGRLLATVDPPAESATTNTPLVRIWSMPEGKVIGLAGGSSPSWSYADNLLLTTTDDAAFVYAPPALAPIFAFRWDAFAYRPAVGWAGSRLLVTGDDTYLVDPRTREEFGLPRDPSDWAIPTVSPAGDVIVVRHDVRLSSRRSRPELSFHDLQGRQLLRAPGETVAFGRDGRTVAVSSGGESWAPHQPSVDETHTDVWRLGGTAPEFSVPGRRATFDETGTRLTTASPDGRAWVWETAIGAPVARVGDFVVLAAEIAGGRGAGGPEEPPPTPVQRFAVVRHPDRVTAGRLFTIDATLTVDQPAGLELAQPVTVTPSRDTEGRPTGAPDVQVRIWAPAGLAVTGSALAELPVLPDADSPLARFELVADDDASGPYAVPVGFFQGPRALGRVLAVLTVDPPTLGAAAPAPQRITASMVIENPPADDVVEPDVAFSVVRSTAGTHDALHWAYCWKAQGWRWVDGGTTTFGRPVQDWAEDKHTQLSKLARPGQRPSGSVRAELDQLGQNLYRDLFPPDVKAFYERAAAATKTLIVYTDEPWIPWELVKPWGETSSGDFLCIRHDLARWYLSDKGRVAPAQVTVRMLARVVRPTDLRAVHREAAYLNRLPTLWKPLQSWRPMPRYPRDVVSLLEHGSVDLLHFATHGRLSGESYASTSISLGSEALALDAIVGSEVAGGIRRAAPFVFMNACHTGRRQPGLGRVDGWAERFLEFGASAFIGASWEIADDLAADFAAAVYDALRGGASLAGAVRTARIKVRASSPDNSTWLAYCLYGHPNATVVVQ